MHAKLSKKRSRRKKNKALILDEEAGEEDDVSQDEWKLGKGILLLALAAGFTLASLLVKPPWRSLGDERDTRDEWRSKEAFGGAASVAVSEDWPREEPEPFSPPSGPLSGPSVEKAVQFQKVKVLSSSSERAGSREPGNLQDPRIVWIHLHSYGGTTICDLARAHGEKVSPAKDNCNLMPDGCSTPAQFRIGCLKRLQSMQYTFTAVERSLDEEDLTCLGERRMLFGLMLRDPVAGIKSTLIGNQLEKGLMLQALRSRVVPRNLAFHFCLPPFDTYQHLDNFAVRTLSGAYDQPPGGMSMAHLERAKGVVSKLDVVLIMEELQEHLPQLRAIFGWDVDLKQNPWHSHWHRIPKNVFSPEEAAFLRQANDLDYQLYEYARTVARQLTAQAAPKVGSSGT